VTHTNTPGNTPTSTATQPPDQFKVCQNVFHVSTDGTTCFVIATAEFPGVMELKIYNSAGEHVKTLFTQALSGPLPPTTVTWDGRNKYGQPVASGVYIVYLIKPYGRLLARIAVIR
jgi:flagellar hook assembly protein FlgD